MNTTLNYQLVKEIDWCPARISFSSVSKLYVPISVLNLSIVYQTKLMPIILGIFKDLYKPTNPSVLEERTSARGLSSLHIATISGNEQAVEQLVDAGVCLDGSDRFGWSAIHHAALLGHTKILSLLIEKGADVEKKTNTKATYQIIQSLVYPPSYKSDEPMRLFWKDRQGNLSRLTQGEYQQKTSALFLEECKMTQVQMFNTWGNLKAEWGVFPFSGDLNKSYERYLKNPGSHVLADVMHDSSGKMLTHSPGLGVYAKEDIARGEILGEYFGEIVDDPEAVKDPEYLLNEVDSKRYRNEIAQINDGFCNTTIIPVYNERGLSVRYVLVSVDPIKEGDQFCWDYGPVHIVKNGPYLELRPKETRDFFKEHKMDFLIKSYNKVRSGECSLPEISIGDKFAYLMNTPSVLFSLTFEGILSLEDSLRVQNAHIQTLLQEGDSISSFMYYLSSTANSCKEVHQMLIEQGCPETACVYAAYIATLSEKKAMDDVLSCAQFINKYITKHFRVYQVVLDELFLSELKEKLSEFS